MKALKNKSIKLSLVRKVMKNERGEGSLGVIIGACAVVIVAAFVLIPGLRTFATSVITSMTTWYSTTMSGKLFPTT